MVKYKIMENGDWLFCSVGLKLALNIQFGFKLGLG